MFNIGDRIAWKAAGKGARLDGVDGLIVTGTVTRLVDADGLLSVEGDYESAFAGHLVDVDDATLIEAAPMSESDYAYAVEFQNKAPWA